MKYAIKALQLLIVIILMLSTVACGKPTTWKKLASGMEYTNIQHTPGFPIGTIHAFKIDLSQYRLELALTHNNRLPLTTVQDLVQQHNSLLGINGGFFNTDLMPLGLRIKDGQIISTLKGVSWWSVFYTTNNQANIVTRKAFTNNIHVRFAVQSGPRLLIDGLVPTTLKPGLANRSALCITASGAVIIVATENLYITMKDFANILANSEQQGGLSCYNAINLDGGSSTQLFAKIGDFKLNLSGYAPVADAILVLRR